MAGRGTDIMLGGSVDFLADEELRRQGLDPVEHSDEYEAAWPAMLARMDQQVRSEHDDVNDLGGLYVVGTERHESRRIDNQLRGRSGRQGDPGESRFYLSLQDDLMRLFKSDWVDWVLQTMKIPDDVPIENKRVTGAIASAQRQDEGPNIETRNTLLTHDDVMTRQREVIYAERRRVLEGADLEEQIRGMIADTVQGYVVGATEGFPEEWDLDRLWTALKQLYPVVVTRQELEDEVDGEDQLTREFLLEALQADAAAAYDRREEQLTPDILRELERQVVLSVLDRKWREHLYEMDYLREGIGLRAYSQRDPLVEYQREGFELFTAMMESIKEETVGFLFHVEVQVERPVAPAVLGSVDDIAAAAALLTGQSETATEAVPEPALPEPEPQVEAESEPHRPHVMAKGLGERKQPRNLSYSAPTIDGDAGSGSPQVRVGEEEDVFAKVGPNQQCPCGSGLKYKKCHGSPARRNA
jgi:preprotein translocase subunit SecA